MPVDAHASLVVLAAGLQACSASLGRASKRLRSIPGIGIVGATAIAPPLSRTRRFFDRVATLQPGSGSYRGKNSTGGKQKLGPISKRGDQYLRRILVVGAHAVLERARHQAGPTSPSRSSSATASGLPDAVPTTTGGDCDGDLRFPRGRLLRMPGSATTRGRLVSRDHDTDHLAFCWTENISAPNLSYAAQYLALRTPLSTLRLQPHDRTRMTRGRAFHRNGFAPSTFRRSPGAPVHTRSDTSAIGGIADLPGGCLKRRN